MAMMHEPRSHCSSRTRSLAQRRGWTRQAILQCYALVVARTSRRFPQGIEKEVLFGDSEFAIVSATATVRKSSSASSSVRKALPKKLRSQFYACHQPVAAGTFN